MDSWAISRLLWSLCLTSSAMWTSLIQGSFASIQICIPQLTKRIRIDGGDLSAWVKRLLDSWEQQVSISAYWNTPTLPSSANIDLHEIVVARISTAAVIAERMEACAQSSIESRTIQRLYKDNKPWSKGGVRSLQPMANTSPKHLKKSTLEVIDIS